MHASSKILWSYAVTTEAVQKVDNLKAIKQLRSLTLRELNCWKHFAIPKHEPGKLKCQPKKLTGRRNMRSNCYLDKYLIYLHTGNGYIYCSWRTYLCNSNYQRTRYQLLSPYFLGCRCKVCYPPETRKGGGRGTNVTWGDTPSPSRWGWVCLALGCSLAGLSALIIVIFEAYLNQQRRK